MLRREIIFYDYSLGFSVRWPTFEHNVVFFFFFSASKTQIFLKWISSMVDCLLTPQSLSQDCCHCLSTMHYSRSYPSKLLTYLSMPLPPSVHWMELSFLIDPFTQPALQVWIQMSRTSVLRKHLSCTIFYACGAVFLFHVITARERQV